MTQICPKKGISGPEFRPKFCLKRVAFSKIFHLSWKSLTKKTKLVVGNGQLSECFNIFYHVGFRDNNT